MFEYIYLFDLLLKVLLQLFNFINIFLSYYCIFLLQLIMLLSISVFFFILHILNVPSYVYIHIFISFIYLIFYLKCYLNFLTLYQYYYFILYCILLLLILILISCCYCTFLLCLSSWQYLCSFLFYPFIANVYLTFYSYSYCIYLLSFI